MCIYILLQEASSYVPLLAMITPLPWSLVEYPGGVPQWSPWWSTLVECPGGVLGGVLQLRICHSFRKFYRDDDVTLGHKLYIGGSHIYVEILKKTERV